MEKTILKLSLTTFMLVAGEIRFAAIGNWGDDQPIGQRRQQHVADIMDQWCGLNRCDFLLSLGDNFYPDGVSSDDDIKFVERWRNVYNGDNIRDLRWYMTLGDHDHLNNHENHQLQFAVLDDLWEMPFYYYNFVVEEDETSALFYALDTPSLKDNKHHPDNQLANLEYALMNSRAQWKIVFGHHHPVSVGNIWGDTTVLDEVMPICDRRGVDVFLGGHDNSLQHITHNNMDIIVSGAGGRNTTQYNWLNEDRVRNMGFRPIFFSGRSGFVGVILSEDKITVQYYTYRLRKRRGPKRVRLRKLYQYARLKT